METGDCLQILEGTGTRRFFNYSFEGGSPSFPASKSSKAPERGVFSFPVFFSLVLTRVSFFPDSFFSPPDSGFQTRLVGHTDEIFSCVFNYGKRARVFFIFFSLSLNAKKINHRSRSLSVSESEDMERVVKSQSD